MTEVRKHKRKTASGKTTTVRQYHRDTGDGDGTESGEAWEERMVSASAAPQVSSFAPAEPAAAGDFWADDDPGDPVDEEFTRMQEQMREWRAHPVEVPPAEPDTSPLGRVLGTDTQEGAGRFARLKAYREAGYDGPLDQDNNIPDPDDPAEHEALHALAALSLTHGRA